MNNVPPQVKEEGASPKLYVGGKDKYGRPIIYMKPKYQNTKESIHQLQHLVIMLQLFGIILKGLVVGIYARKGHRNDGKWSRKVDFVYRL